VPGPRPEKVAVVERVSRVLSSARAVIVTEYRGLDVPSLEALRSALRGQGASYVVAKNTLVRRAAEAEGATELVPFLTGPTALATTEGDVVALAKALVDFARTHPALVLRGGLLEGRVLRAEEVSALARIEPREVLLARLASAMGAPLQRFGGDIFSFQLVDGILETGYLAIGFQARRS
jgi:large subunit ribosomal protein L10